MPTLNTALLREVADRIELEDRFDLSCFAYHYGDDREDGQVRPSEVLDHCGTTACVAGWLNALDGHEPLNDTTHAAGLLNIDVWTADRLFFWGSRDTVWQRLADELGLRDEVTGTLQVDRITAPIAAKGLRMLADGEVTL